MEQEKIEVNTDARPADEKERLFLNGFNLMQQMAYLCAYAHGWWDDEESGQRRNDAEMIALMHSELSEALEGLRHGNPPDESLPQLTSAEVELADCIIRIMDMAERRGYDIARAIVEKYRYNCNRPHKHGGKKF